MRSLNIFVLIFLFLFSNKIIAQLPKKTDGAKMKATITEIASDAFKGRETGTPEGIQSEAYFANEFKKLGLKPAGENGSYYHTFSYSDYDQGKSELTIEGHSFLPDDLDFYPMYYSDGGSAEGEIVFAGYGINSPKLKRNDFDSIDIKDKIVLIRRGCPDNDFDKWGAEAIDSVKAQYCYDKGAKAILFFSPRNYNTEQIDVTRNWIAYKNVIKNFPIVMIEEQVVQYILQSTKLSYYRMMQGIDFKNVSFGTGKKAILKVEAHKLQGNARNVLAMLPGSDPKLKNEYIIIGGHLDHIGLNSNKEICNGADDNASGVAVTLGIAQAMIKNKFKPKRTIVFACWMGEEMGLLGSEAWCNKPTLDIYKTVVYFNLDMVGLGDGKLDMPGTLYAPEIANFIKENTDTVALKKINWSEGGLGGSDHNYFLMHGIPAFAGMTSGDHPAYHRPGDDADKIDASILQFVGDFIYHSTEIIAQSKQNFISQSRFDENQARLKEERWFTPLAYTNYAETIGQSKPKIAVVDFSEGLGNNADQNFLTILKNYNKAETTAKESGKMIFKSKARDIVSTRWWDDQISLISAFNLNAVGCDELYIKALSKCGFKLALVDETFLQNADTAKQRKIIELIDEQQMGIVLNNQDLEKLRLILEKSKSPVMILTKPNTVINENILNMIKEKGHLMVLQVNSSTPSTELIKAVKFLEEKLGRKSIALTCDKDQKSTETYKNIILKMEKDLGTAWMDELTNENFNLFMVKSLQEYPVKIIW